MKNVPSRSGPLGWLEGITPAKFSFTNTSSLHGVCSDGSLAYWKQGALGRCGWFSRKLNLISFVYDHELFFSTCQFFVAWCSMFNTFWHHFKFSILQVFRSRFFQLHHLYAYAPFNFTFPLQLRSSIHICANLIIRIKTMSKTMPVWFWASTLSLSI